MQEITQKKSTFMFIFKFLFLEQLIQFPFHFGQLRLHIVVIIADHGINENGINERHADNAASQTNYPVFPAFSPSYFI